MTPIEQKRFVKGLSKTIANDIVEKIAQGRIPDDWEGAELRWYLESKHTWSGNNFASRKNKFRNDMIVNNL